MWSPIRRVLLLIRVSEFSWISPAVPARSVDPSEDPSKDSTLDPAVRLMSCPAPELMARASRA